MPRLPTSLIKQAQRIHSFLPLLLRPCRNLDSARNELRWLAEHQRKLVSITADNAQGDRRPKLTAPTLRDLCLERSHGRPLQYVLGTQPFGNLEILCRKGVLIPR
jgi:methylase of polypeptide subunit release factors